jgi:uncharacterized membrane protein
MEPLLALVLGLLTARLAGLLGIDALDGWHPALRIGLATMFVLTGLAHFVGRRRADLVAMVPPALPSPGLLVTITGVLELASAVGLLLPPTAPAAGGALALLMLAMFPANVSAARRGLTLAGRPVTPIGARTLLQAIYVGAAVAVAAGP